MDKLILLFSILAIFISVFSIFYFIFSSNLFYLVIDKLIDYYKLGVSFKYSKTILLWFFLVPTLHVFCQSQDQNYIKTTVVLESVDINTLNNFSNSIKKVENVTYLDGFGKAKQTIAIGQSPNKKDIVKHIKYDEFGRASKQYLALPTHQNTGDYISNAEAQIGAYYQNNFADQHPFSEIRFDNSPLNRTLESSSPGNTWQILNNSDNGHTTKYKYAVNDYNEVLRFNIINNTNNPFQISHYQKKELLKNIIKNENWDVGDGLLNTQEVFINKNGRKIAEFSYKTYGSGVKKLSTYYVYDDIGNLRYTLTPKAIENLYVDNNYTPFNLNFNWTQFVENPSSVTNGSGNVNIISQSTSINHQLIVDFNLGFPFIFGGTGGAYLKQGNVVALPSNANLPNRYLFSIYSGKVTQPVLDDLEDFGAISGNTNKSRYEYSIKDGYIFVEFLVGTDFGSPNAPFKIRGVDRTFARYFSTTVFNESIMDNLCFKYRYDQFNRQTEQKVPGRGWEYIVYDQLDRPILTQDANLKAQNKWLFTKYDVFGRAVYSGVYTNDVDRASLQTQVNSFINSSSNTANIESRGIGLLTIGGIAINYTNNAFPVSNLETLNVSYFDDYNFTDLNLPSIPTFVLGQEVTNRTKGVLTATWTKTLETNLWAKNYTFYDKKGRVIYTYDRNHLGGNTQNKSKLDFRGKILKSVTNHKRINSSNDLTISDRFEYDHIERPKKHFQRINNQNDELIASNTYNELGQLEKKNIGGLEVDGTINLYENISPTITVSNNSIERVSGSSWTNAGLTTKGEITNEGSVSYEVLTTNKNMMIGLAAPNIDPHYESINFAIYNYALADSNGGSKLLIFEGGQNIGHKTNYQIGDVLSIERDASGYVHYKKNGEIFYSSESESLPYAGKLVGDISMYSFGGKIKNLKISSDYTDIVGLNVSNITNNTQQIKKETGSAGWNAGLATVNAIKQDGDGYISYRISQVNKNLMVGVSESNLNASYNTIKYAIYHKSSGTLEVRITGPSEIYNENITYQVGDEFSIERVGSDLNFKKNGDIFFTKSGVISGSLIGDISMHTIGSAIYDLEIQNNEPGVQMIDYTYNIRGWLTHVNDVNNIGDDLFAYNLKYDENIEGNSSVGNIFNGNIKQVIWKSALNNTKKSYAFEYDKLDRFSSSHYRENNTLTDGDGKFETYGIKYDSNGNIKELRRNTHSGSLMDRLGYTYDEGNKLLSIGDFGGTNEGFKDGSNSDQDYEYDVNGNLTKDLNKGIERIDYNHLDLVKEVAFINGNRIEFFYDANGSKLEMKSITAAGVVTTIGYLGGFQYTNAQLQFFQTPEGYASKDGVDFKYVYVLKDHLGNNRVSYSDVNNDGVINSAAEILSNTDHYVMGLTHFGESISGIASNYNYKLHGKEQLTFSGYNMYDFGSRMYDPAVGRWFNADPLNEFSSPYLAMGNNPVMLVDPDGRGVFLAGIIAGAYLGLMQGIHNNQTNGRDPYNSKGIVKGVGKGALNGVFGINAVIASGIDFISQGYASVDIPVTNSFSLTLSPAIASGTNGGSIGLNLTGNLDVGDWTLSASLGGSYYDKAVGTGKSGFGSITSFGVAYDDGETGFSLYRTSYSNIGGTGGQRLGGLSFRSGDFSFRYENDGGLPFKVGKGKILGDGGDSYRTAALQIGYTSYQVGFNLFTGKREYVKGEDAPKTAANPKGKVGELDYGPYGRRAPNGFVKEIGTPYRLGALYLGYNGYRLGVNSEHVRNAIQNHAIHDLKILFGLIDLQQPGFKNQSWDWKGYIQYNSINKFSLWH